MLGIEKDEEQSLLLQRSEHLPETPSVRTSKAEKARKIEWEVLELSTDNVLSACCVRSASGIKMLTDGRHSNDCT